MVEKSGREHPNCVLEAFSDEKNNFAMRLELRPLFGVFILLILILLLLILFNSLLFLEMLRIFILFRVFLILLFSLRTIFLGWFRKSSLLGMHLVKRGYSSAKNNRLAQLTLMLSSHLHLFTNLVYIFAVDISCRGHDQLCFGQELFRSLRYWVHGRQKLY